MRYRRARGLSDQILVAESVRLLLSRNGRALYGVAIVGDSEYRNLPENANAHLQNTQGSSDSPPPSG